MKLFRFKKTQRNTGGRLVDLVCLFYRVPVISIIIMKEKNELCKEPKEIKEEEDVGITAKMAKEMNEAKKEPPKEGV